jgi:hypothetical protein
VSALALVAGLIVVTVTAYAITQSRLSVLFAIPAALAGAAIAARHPGLALGGATLLVGFIGTLRAYADFVPAVAGADFVLLCAWLGVIWHHATGERGRDVRLWAPIVPLLLYVVLTAASIPFADVVSDGADSFRLSAWYILAVPFIALSPWSSEALRRVAHVLLLVALLVAAVCAVRYATGPSADELLVARQAQPSLPGGETLRFFGTFPSAQELSAWCSVMIPFALGTAVAWTGLWRLVATAALGLTVLVLLASEVRTGIAAAGAGAALVLVLFAFTRAISVKRRVLTLASSAVILFAAVGGAYLITVEGDPEAERRIEGIFNPSDDTNFQIRQSRWTLALDDIAAEPLGHGLGTAGAVGLRSERLPVGPAILDSSYLKVGLEQGAPVMVYYALAMAILLIALAYRAIRTPSRERAAIAIGAAGTLLAMGLLFFGSLYAELPSAVVPGWIIVGLGCAQFAIAHGRSPAERPRK